MTRSSMSRIIGYRVNGVISGDKAEADLWWFIFGH